MADSKTRLRITFGVLAAVSFGLAAWLAGVGSWQFWLCALGPDLALFAGIGAGLRPGQLHPRAVPIYNAVHILTGPAILAALSPWLGRAWLGGSFAWAAHIWMDRSFGFGLRDRTGFIRGRV